jgi:hypothetical protein
MKFNSKIQIKYKLLERECKNLRSIPLGSSLFLFHQSLSIIEIMEYA